LLCNFRYAETLVEIYRIPISEIIKIFQLVGNDYPSKVKMIWANKIDDYKITTD